MNCKFCAKEIPIKTKWDKRKIFCNSSCASSFNCKGRKLSEETKNKIRESCYKLREQDPDRFPSGQVAIANGSKATKGKFKSSNLKSIEDVSTRTITKILLRLKLGCSICGWKESVCDIHHINGRKIENCNDHSNLCYLCPNCHRLADAGKIDKNILVPLNEYLPSNWTEYYYG